MNEFDQMYREVILDHYKNPRHHGSFEGADAEAEGQNPLCGDEVTVSVKFGADGETIDEMRFEGRGCAISQAATSPCSTSRSSSTRSRSSSHPSG